MMNRSSLGIALVTAGGIFGILALGLAAPPRAHAFFGDFDADFVPDAVEVFTGSDGTSPLSTPESLWASSVGFVPPIVCGDAFDNDGDGLTDALDPGCMNSDGDFYPVPPFPLDDAVEAGLGSIPVFPFSTPEHWFIDFIFGPFTCANLADDDTDGPIDFPADFTCHIDVDLDGLPAAFGDSEGISIPNTGGLFGTNDCADGLDNDGDGSTDLLDPDCLDNDGDGLANPYDSEGPQGIGSSSGLGSGDDCYDGVDNDDDGLIDSLEPDCGLCYGLVPTLVGTAGNDVLIGTAGPDVIMGLEGDDRIRGLDADDYICAGPGNDRVGGSRDNDVISGSDGNDIIVGNVGNDTLFGNAGDDRIVGSAGGDTLSGGAGADRLIGSADNDGVFGDAGNDIIRGGGGDDFLSGNDGDDDIRAAAGNDFVLGDAGSDFLRGNVGDDLILGGDDGDNMTGGGGIDTCDGQGSLLDVAPGASCETLLNVP